MITLLNKFDDHYIIEQKDVPIVAEAYVKENHLESLYHGTFLVDDNIGAEYLIMDKIIRYNYNNILNYSKNIYSSFKKIYQIADEYDSYFINFYFLSVIYHDLMHINQLAKLDRESNALYIYLYQLFIRIKQDDAFYKKYHSLFPMEIEANNIGYLTAFNLMNHTKLPSKKALIMYIQYLYSLSSNYRKLSDYKVETPIELLREESSLVDLEKINELIDRCKTHKIERMNLGLRITPKEFDLVDEEKYKTIIKTIF